MNVTTEIDDQRAIVIVKITGQATAEEVGAEYGRIFEDPTFKFNMNALWDISGLNLTKIPISEVRALSRALSQHSEKRGTNYHAAIVTTRNADYQLVRMYSTLLKLIGSFRMRVFSKNEEALNWLIGVSKR